MARSNHGRGVCVGVAGLVMVAAAGPAHATIQSAGGDAVITPAPASLLLDALESNDVIRAINEAQDVTLPRPLEVDITVPGSYTTTASLTTGVIPAGTVVRSHMLHADPIADGPANYEGFVIFDASQPVIGILVGRNRLLATDALLGNAGTLYSDNAARGLELGGGNGDRVVLSPDRLRVGVFFSTSTAMDEIRILTIPGPGAVGLAGAGLLALARRRR